MMNRQNMQKAFAKGVQSMGGMGAFKNQIQKAMPTSMFTRPPVTQNKARGTMASHTYSPIPNSVSGMGFGAPATMAPSGAPQPSGPSGMGTQIGRGNGTGKPKPAFM